MSATLAVPPAFDTRIMLSPELNTLLFTFPNDNTPVIFMESFTTDETFTLLLAIKLLMVLLVKLLPEMACAVDPASSMVPAEAVMVFVAVIVPAICIVALLTVNNAPALTARFLTAPVPAFNTGMLGAPSEMEASELIVGTAPHQLARLDQLLLDAPIHWPAVPITYPVAVRQAGLLEQAA